MKFDIAIHGLDAAMAALDKRGQQAMQKAIPALAESVGRTAEKRWYGRGGVDRQTGASGDIRVVVEAGGLTAHVGSADDRPEVVFFRSKRDGQRMVHKYLIKPMRARARRLARKIAREMRRG